MPAKVLFTPVAATVLILGTSGLTTAQMGGMGSTMPGPMPGAAATAPAMHSGSSSKAAAIGAASGAAGAGLLYWRLHNRATLLGCVGGDGDTLVNDADSRTYTLISKDVVLRPGERVELKGKKLKHGTVFEVHKMAQDFGHCGPITAEKK